ncbi:hypothetical protein SLA2020_233080 [Shorea laevis]
MATAYPNSLYPILLCLLPVSVLAQTYNNITLGSSLTAVLNDNSSWTSPFGEFTFGFQIPSFPSSILYPEKGKTKKKSPSNVNPEIFQCNKYFLWVFLGGPAAWQC